MTAAPAPTHDSSPPAPTPAVMEFARALARLMAAEQFAEDNQRRQAHGNQS